MLSATEKAEKVEISQRIQETICDQDRISALPDDLLVGILLFVPTKDAVATMILSKRWQTIWTTVPKLEFEEINTGGEHESVWWLLEKSLKLHKAPLLESLCIRLGEKCPTDVDVTKCVANAVDRCVRKLLFQLRWSAKPTSMPQSLYTCETLVELELYEKILLDVPPSVCLPSVTKLYLWRVVYEDEVSFVRLLASCPILRCLLVARFKDDNVKNYCVKVPSLEEFDFMNDMPLSRGNDRSLVLDCPALKNLSIDDSSGDSCCIGDLPRIVRAEIDIFCYPDKKFLRYLSAATSLSLTLSL